VQVKWIRLRAKRGRAFHGGTVSVSASMGPFGSVGDMDGAHAAYMGRNSLLQLRHAAIPGGDVLAAVPKEPIEDGTEASDSVSSP
jgi:hypothetical protein